MNVLIVDTEQITLELINQIGENVMSCSGLDDLIVIPKGIDIMQDISVDWMKMIRDKMDEKIKEIEGDDMRCMVCGSEMVNTIGGNYNCPKCNHSFNDLVYRPAYDTGVWGAFEGKNIYVFYSPFTNHDNKDDVVVVAAISKEEAISKLRKYYANASEDNVKEVEFNRDDVCIICDTY